jgi:hypothetical protein
MHTKIEGAVADRPSSSTTLPKNFNGRYVHMIGIGGCGMSGAAALLRDLGAVVSGSDLAVFDGLGPLVQSGVRVGIGHHETHLSSQVELVVVSAAVPESNPELSAARRRGLPVMKYAQLLGELTTIRRRWRSPAPTAKHHDGHACIFCAKPDYRPPLLLGRGRHN